MAITDELLPQSIPECRQSLEARRLPQGAFIAFAACLLAVSLIAASVPRPWTWRWREPLHPAALLTVAEAPARVKVEVYGMAGCPFTRAFIEGPLTETLTIAADLIDFQIHPFGNHYFVTETCGGTVENMPFASYFKGYNQTTRQCWDSACGAAVAQPAPDCFSGALVSQHGIADGKVTTAWACAKSLGKGVMPQYMPFIRCTANRFLGITSEPAFFVVLQDCARESSLDEEALLKCTTGLEGLNLLQAEGRATVPHPTVPFVLIDHVVLGDTKCVTCGDGIMQQICTSWLAHGGVSTPACMGVLGQT